MIVDFKFNLGDIVYIKCQGTPRGKIVARLFEYEESITIPNQIYKLKNRSYKVKLLEEYDPQRIMLPELLAEDRIFATEKEAANEVLRANGFSLRF